MMARKSANKYLVFAGMGTELLGIILASVWIGNILDQKYDLKGLGLVGLSVLGLAGWLWHIIVLAKRLDGSSPSNIDDN